MSKKRPTFTFRVQMLGLCLFIQNKAKTKFAVVLPNLSGSREFGAVHHARFIFNRNQVERTLPGDALRLEVLSLVRERIEFKYFDEHGHVLPPSNVVVKLPKSVTMEEIVGDEAEYLTNLLGLDPDFSVMAQAFFDRGSVSEELGTADYKVPQAKGPNPFEIRKLPAFVKLEVPDVSRVEVKFSRLTKTLPQVNENLAFVAGPWKDVHVTISSDCQLIEAEYVHWPQPTKDEPDKDFEVHYQYLEETFRKAFAARVQEVYPVPIHLASSSIFSGCLLRLLPSLFLLPMRGLVRGWNFLLPFLALKFAPLGGPVVLDPSGKLKMGTGGGGSDCQSCVAVAMDFPGDPDFKDDYKGGDGGA
jgi:hypothetical protein